MPADSARLVCFDLGGVLVRTSESWADAYRAAGLDVREEPGDAAFRARRRELADLHGRGRITLEEWAEGLSAAMGGVYSAQELKRGHRAILREEHPGAVELVAGLHAAGVATACLSNTSHTHWLRLVHRDGDRSLGGAPEYPAVTLLGSHFASHLLGLLKPDPAIYARFEELTGRAPAEILFFDDRDENVAAARARGWDAERITGSHLEAVMEMREHLRRRGM